MNRNSINKRVVSSPEDKKKLQSKLSSMLFKQKEQLKRDIAKKRALLEKELSVEINREVDSLKQKAQLKLDAQKGKYFLLIGGQRFILISDWLTQISTNL